MIELIKSSYISFSMNQKHKILQSEKFKALLSLIFFVISFFTAFVSLALVHEKLPDRNVYRPLPDFILDNVPSIDILFCVADIQIAILIVMFIVFVSFHKHRFVIFKRTFFLLSILFLYRGITIYVTALPVPSITQYCSPKSESLTFNEVIERAITLTSGIGLSINNKHIYCGDSIFSGHTTALVFGYLLINQYSPPRFHIYFSFVAYINAIVGVTFVLLSHMHYTIDVIVAYYLTTRLFWSYHSALGLTSLTKSSSGGARLVLSYETLKNEWFWPLFKYMESDKEANQSFTNEFDLPWRKNKKSNDRQDLVKTETSS